MHHHTAICTKLIAVDTLEDTDFRYGEKASIGPMRVTEADPSYKVHEREGPIDTGQVHLEAKHSTLALEMLKPLSENGFCHYPMSKVEGQHT